MTKEIFLDGCKCVCDSTKEIVAQEIQMGSYQHWLQIGLVGLVVLLVILGLIIGFNKLKSSDDDNDNDEDEYY